MTNHEKECTTDPVLESVGLRRSYRRGSETVQALRGVDLTIRRGEMVAILGPSGSGKTTLINLLSCLDAPDGGRLTIAGASVETLSEEELTGIRRGRIGYIFQKFHLLPSLNVAENVELPLLFLDRPADRGKTIEVLRLVGLEDRAFHLPSELSGGQMQRVAIARAIIVRPEILIADEPTGNLDRANGEAIFDLFRKLIESEGLSVIVTTHNHHLGCRADRVITLEDGLVTREESGAALRQTSGA
ncbi:ABC transporter ATP-binding protein [Candidatus Ozemobacteraceae bacterium]|nr:ABC transporter ATP-binding protein [Candidatus Ozemobacteraceae bacterium]